MPCEVAKDDDRYLFGEVEGDRTGAKRKRRTLGGKVGLVKVRVSWMVGRWRRLRLSETTISSVCPVRDQKRGPVCSS